MIQYLLTALIDFIFAGLALFKKDNKAARALSAAAFCVGVWSIELYLLSSLQDLELLDLWFHITRVGMFFIPATLALLAWRITFSASLIFKWAVLLPGFISAISLSIANIFFFPSELQKATGGYLPVTDTIYLGFAATFVYCLAASMFHCAVSYRRVTMRQRQRIRWLMITLGVTFFTGVVSIVLMPYDFYLSKFIGALTNIAFVSLLFYSTVQHHLMDVRLAISEGGTRLLILGVLVLFFFSVQSVYQDFANPVNSALVTGIILIAMLEFYPKVLRSLLPGARRLIARGGYDFRQVVEETTGVLNDTVDYSRLRKVCDHLFFQILRLDQYHLVAFTETDHDRQIDRARLETLSSLIESKRGVVLVDETSSEAQEIMREFDAHAAMSIRHGGVNIGLLLLGLPAGYAYYRYDDIRLLERLQMELSITLNRIDRLDQMNDQLGHAKKTLSMLGVMNHYHHDIKAPLAIIDGVLSNDIYDKDKQKDIVLEQVERGSKLIATMAELLKGERVRKIKDVSLKYVIDDSLYLFQQGIDDLHVKHGNVPMIRGDAEDLKILMINLVKNAIEAKRDGEPLAVSVTTVQTPEHIVLRVADTGMGMSSAQIKTLWSGLESAKEFGSGIGMQAIKRIAEEHQAEIDVSSRVGVGTTFIFRFPISLAVDSDDTSSAKSQDVQKPIANF